MDGPAEVKAPKPPMLDGVAKADVPDETVPKAGSPKPPWPNEGAELGWPKAGVGCDDGLNNDLRLCTA